MVGRCVMREGHCAKCGYLSEWHDAARRCPGIKTGVWTDRDPIDGALWRQILARDAAARTLAPRLDPEGWADGSAEKRGRVFDRATRILLGLEQEKQERADLLRPIIPARPPRGPEEFAGGQGKQALGLGRLAAICGFELAPYYWRSGRNVEGCAVKGYRPGLAFVATWERKPGAAWKSDVVYAWGVGAPATFGKYNVTRLEQIIRGG